MQSTSKIFAETALLADGWARDVLVTIDDGRISSVDASASPSGADRVSVLLPAMANLHSHAFQRAMAGMTEYRANERDSFWSWRALMYQFLERLEPDDVEAITALAQVEMLEAGFASVAEFHYLHHQPGGAPYDNRAEMAARVAAAAKKTGIGLTLCPVLYQRGGCDGRVLEGGQLRFGNSYENYQAIYDGARKAIAAAGADGRVGVAAHSLRAVDKAGLDFLSQLGASGPVHIHIAEQTAEIDEVKTAYGARPVEWLLANMDVDERWCLVHATHMTPEETTALAQSGAVAGLCPITECNLGDGIFDGARFLHAGGAFGVGSDSNVRIDMTEELRTLEYSQRLKNHARAVLTANGKSVGRTLYEGASRGGAQALGRDCGAIESGKLADLVALDGNAIDLAGREGDQILDTALFAAGQKLIRDVWSAGRHVVKEGRHVKRAEVESTHRKATVVH